MGSWVITIRGHGAHHNGRTDDADAMTAAHVRAMRLAGHEIETASLTLDGEGEGRETDLLQGFTPVVHYPAGLESPVLYQPPE